ncbi:MAG: copper resistance protein NlpE N-terminal domain-containing protein [Cruoricaptor ignavus]|nr:copper resistance protein NlpE N-terminal domain-containing protein [Cruoricaptor ignavus]
MKKTILPILFGGLLLASCNQKTEQTAEMEHATADSLSTKMANSGDSTETSVDWDGTYKGTIPCADCPGIEITLTLNSDKTYIMGSKYQERENANFSDKGTFDWSEDGSFITLKDANDPSETKVFFVGEGNIWMVSQVGERDLKDEYKLDKI